MAVLDDLRAAGRERPHERINFAGPLLALECTEPPTEATDSFGKYARVGDGLGDKLRADLPRCAPDSFDLIALFGYKALLIILSASSI